MQLLWGELTEKFPKASEPKQRSAIDGKVQVKCQAARRALACDPSSAFEVSRGEI